MDRLILKQDSAWLLVVEQEELSHDESLTSSTHFSCHF